MNRLILFIKWPEEGRVKTRLQPQMTPRQSLEIYRAMVEDLLEELGSSPAFELQIHFWPPEKAAEIAGWLGGGYQYLPQHGADLGDKMFNAFADSSETEAAKTVIIGSDLPSLTRADIRGAFAALDSAELVLGPTDDGGYYLIGCKKPDRRIFEQVAWSSEAVLSKTLQNAASAGIKTVLLEQRVDLDTHVEVQQLRAAIKESTPGNISAAMPRTRAFLEKTFPE